MLNFEWMKNHQRDITVMGIIILILFITVLAQNIQQSRLYMQKDGRVLAIKRESVEKVEEVPLLIDIELDGEIRTYEVSLSLKGMTDVQTEQDSSFSMSSDSIKFAIEEIISALEEKEATLIQLPEVLNDGKPIIWKMPEDKTWLLIPLLFPMGIGLLYYGEISREKQMKKRKCEKIKKALPAFNDQLLLLMNCGLIFHDAFYRIADNYRSRRIQDEFSDLILSVVLKTETSGGSIVSVMRKSAEDVSVREYSRMVNILTDNQYKGVDLREKLEAESNLLWQMRKASTLQKGKELETKMSFPLAVLLIVLIFIAGMPAMMNI